MNAFWWELSDSIKNREETCELVEEVNAFIDEMESNEDDEVEVNNYEELDENEWNLKLTKICISAKKKVRAMKLMSILSETFVRTVSVDYTVLKWFSHR